MTGGGASFFFGSRSSKRFVSSLLFLVASVTVLRRDSDSNTVEAMRLVVQRVKSASVRVERSEVSSIGPGVMALVGIHENDTAEDASECCKKLLAAKLWENEDGRPWRHGVKQKGLSILLVSQFTLYGTLSKKNQPDFKRSMKAVPAEALYNDFVNMVREGYGENNADRVRDGVFGAYMDVELINDGPVTMVVDSGPKDDKDESPPPSAGEKTK